MEFTNNNDKNITNDKDIIDSKELNIISEIESVSDATEVNDVIENIDIKENLNIQYMDKTKYNVFRLDGHNFSRLTKENFKKPFDISFNDAMKECAMYLYEKFNFKLCFVGSDEISLIYYPIPQSKIDSGTGFDFNGKLFKYMSILASASSSKFALKTGIMNSFDCRHFAYDTLEQIREYLIFRRICTVKNSKMMLAQHYFSYKQLYGHTSNEAVEMLLKEKDIDYYEIVEESIRRGVLIHNIFTEESKDINKKITNDKGERENIMETINYTRKKPVFKDSVEDSIEELV
jgi:tRNA(His) 5'-end guanylyltransferase